MAAIGVRSDLWSVGATMFNLLSGRLVRDDVDIAKLLREAGKTKVQSLREVAPELPGDLVDLVDYALSLEAEARWPTAKTMRRAVRLVHAKIKHDSMKAEREKEDDDDEVSAPSFGVIATREIDPPPLSVAYNTEQKLKIATAVRPPEPKAGPTGDVAIPSLRSSSESTLQSKRAAEAKPAAAPEPAPEPAPPPAPALAPEPAPETARTRAASPLVPGCALAVAVAIVALTALVIVLRR
jgi:hypothetical protein